MRGGSAGVDAHEASQSVEISPAIVPADFNKASPPICQQDASAIDDMPEAHSHSAASVAHRRDLEVMC